MVELSRLKVLFVCSGNSGYGCSPIVRSQGDGLQDAGVAIDYFSIKGKGLLNYLRNVFLLRAFLNRHHYDVVHAHYGLCGMVAFLAGACPLVVSLMGSDLYLGFFLNGCVKLCSLFFWDVTIVKSEVMAKRLGNQRALVIPNGVDLEKFCPVNKFEARNYIGFGGQKHILWVASPKRKEKNFDLAKSAFMVLDMYDVELNVLNEVSHNLMPIYFNAADVLLLTSRREGSPNVIKEALACGLPIVTTRVGDVEALLEGVNGCWICDSHPGDIARGLNQALEFEGPTTGRERAGQIGIKKISEQLIQMYENLIKKN